MANYILKNCKLYANQYDLSGHMNALALNWDADLQEDTCFGDNTKSRLVGIKDVSMQHEGYFEAGTDLPDMALFTDFNNGTEQIITIAPQTGAEGEIGYSFNTRYSNYNWGGSHGEITKISISANGGVTGNEPLIRGRFALNQASLSGSGYGTGVQAGALSSSESMYMIIHVTALSGTVNATMHLESDDNPSFTSATWRLASDTITARGAYRYSISGPITDDYWRINYAISGTSPLIDVVVLVGKV